MSQAYYPKAPIVEAIIDLQVRYKLEGPQTMERFDELHQKMVSRFPKKTAIELFQMGVTQASKNQGVQTQFGQQRIGLKLTNETSDRVVQVQQSGFTYSHMPPYSQWEPFSEEAKSIWANFVEICQPEVISRAAIRFINRVIIPKEDIELRDYFNLFPTIPDTIPQDIIGYFMQLQMPQKDLEDGTLAIINMAMDESPEAGKTAVLLDFDIFRRGDYSPTGNEVWQYLESIRKRKNVLFEACITDKTRELIK